MGSTRRDGDGVRPLMTPEMSRRLSLMIDQTIVWEEEGHLTDAQRRMVRAVRADLEAWYLDAPMEAARDAA